MPSTRRRASFRYQPLDFNRKEFRLLHFEEASAGTLRCTLINTPLTEGYICLSYHWNPAGKPKTVILNGRRFSVSQHLHSFLVIARARWPQNSLWIDAICIDQNNLQEKNHQIPYMGQIYKNAGFVVAFLGADPGGYYELALNAIRDKEMVVVAKPVGGEHIQRGARNFLMKFRTYKQKSNLPSADRFDFATLFGDGRQLSVSWWDNKRLLWVFWGTRQKDREESNLIPVDKQVPRRLFYRKMNASVGFDHCDRIISSLNALFANRYWERAWITQELLLNKKTLVLAGKCLIDWQDVLDYLELKNIIKAGGFANRFAGRIIGVKMTFQSVKVSIHAYSAQNRGLPLRELLVRYHSQRCQDFHDHVYALRALASDGNEITVDYTLSASAFIISILPNLQLERCTRSADESSCYHHCLFYLLYRLPAMSLFRSYCAWDLFLGKPLKTELDEKEKAEGLLKFDENDKSPFMVIPLILPVTIKTDRMKSDSINAGSFESTRENTPRETTFRLFNCVDFVFHTTSRRRMYGKCIKAAEWRYDFSVSESRGVRALRLDEIDSQDNKRYYCVALDRATCMRLLIYLARPYLWPEYGRAKFVATHDYYFDRDITSI